MNTILELIRIRQWYKNLVVFVAIIFAVDLFNPGMLYTTILAFFSLSFLSSGNYIMNDIIDRERDRKHPEKKNRPLASNKISVASAMLILAVMVLAGLGLSYSINMQYFALSLVFLLIGAAYTLVLKNIFLADAITIAVNFVLRAILGAISINVPFSSWLIVCTFFIALTLVFGKRKMELRAGKDHRSVLEFYNSGLLGSLSILSITSLFISYAIYTITHSVYMPLTLPVAAFLLFRYMSFLYSGNKIIENPENLLKDRPIILGSFLWIIMIIVILYFL